MPAYDRIIVRGKNRDFPRTIRLPFGVGVDGSAVTKAVQVRADECKCARCDGWGTLEHHPVNPSERATLIPCPDCNEGVAKVAA